MSYVQSLHHIIIRTKFGEDVLTPKYVRDLYLYIDGFIKEKKCYLYRINGMPNHIHILMFLHQSIALSDFVRVLKISTNLWLKDNECKFPDFICWGREYAAFTVHYKDKDDIIDYIKNQQEHHKDMNFEDEYHKLIVDNGIDIKKHYWLED